MPEILVVGHICLDIVPGIATSAELTPGRLFEVGSAAISVGGAAGNTGIALACLGADVGVIAQVGLDPFGELVQSTLRSVSPTLADGLIEVPSEPTSYTVVINRVGVDRTFLHCPGVNDSFRPSALDAHSLAGAKVLHFGYPQLLRQVYESAGKQLISLFALARSLGILTSLDTTYPDSKSDAGKVDWLAFLTEVLPYTDLFCPSEDELAFMLSTNQSCEEMLAGCLRLGARGVMIKRGENGLILGTSSEFPLACWRSRMVAQPSYPVEVVGTTGCGDAAIAGLLLALLNEWPIERAAQVSAACGAMRCTVLRVDESPSLAQVEDQIARWASGS